MEIEYRRDFNHNYVILNDNQNTDTETYQVRMLLSNDISGLLHCSLRGVDGKTLFCYEITSCQSLKILYQHKPIEIDLLIHLYNQIFLTLEHLQQFLLSTDDLILNPELIFLEPETLDLRLCFLPGHGNTIRQSLRELMEYLLPKLNHQNQNAIMTAYRLYRSIMEESNGPEDWKNCLILTAPQPKKKRSNAPLYDEIQPEHDSHPKETEPQSLSDDIFSEPQKEPSSVYSRSIGIGAVLMLLLLLALFRWFSFSPWILLVIVCALISMGIGIGLWLWIKKRREIPDQHSLPLEAASHFPLTDTDGSKQNTAPPLYGETVYLKHQEPVSQMARLIPLSSSQFQPVPLNKDLILVGKLEDAVDVVLDTPSISRIHAKIQKTGNEYYLSDLNSKNGTFLNGRSLTFQQETLIHDGDELRFADLTFRFTYPFPLSDLHMSRG